MEHHEIAQIFPLMDDSRLQELADDIRENGLLEPITIFEGKVLDGRNRVAACLMAGREIRTKEFRGLRAEAVAYSWSTNHSRRHLTKSQAAAADAKRAKLIEGYAAEVEKMKAEALKKKKASLKRGEEKPVSQKIDERETPPTTANDRRTDAKRAKAAGTNRTYLAEADKLAEDWPQLLGKVEVGELTIPEAGAMRKHLEALPEDDRTRAYAMVDQPGVPAKEGLTILSTLAEMKASARQTLLEDFESGDTDRQSNAMTCAAKLPPMPDARTLVNTTILSQIAKARKLGDTKEYEIAQTAIEKLQQKLRRNYDNQTEELRRLRDDR